jgi:hypothetical protein
MNPDEITGKRQRNRTLRAMMDELSQMSLADGQDKVKAKVKGIEDLFVLWNIPAGGALDLKLDEICAGLEGFTVEETAQLKDVHEKVKYAGFLANKMYRITKYHDHFYFMRTYPQGETFMRPEDPYLEVSWEFGHTGLLKTIAATCIKLNDTTPNTILRVRGEIQRTNGKRTFRAKHIGAMPREMSFLNIGFSDLPFPINFQSLIRFGYGDVKKLRENIAVNNTLPATNLSDDLKDLNLILSHPKTLAMIDNTTKYMPYVKAIHEQGYLNILY